MLVDERPEGIGFASAYVAVEERRAFCGRMLDFLAVGTSWSSVMVGFGFWFLAGCKVAREIAVVCASLAMASLARSTGLF